MHVAWTLIRKLFFGVTTMCYYPKNFWKILAASHLFHELLHVMLWVKLRLKVRLLGSLFNLWIKKPDESFTKKACLETPFAQPARAGCVAVSPSIVDSILSHSSHFFLEIWDILWFNICWDFVVNYCDCSSITASRGNKARDSWDTLLRTGNTLPTFRSRVQFPSPAPKISRC